MADFSQYRAISSKLKKRFLLRKPNLNEASDQFVALSRDLKEFPGYAGYCCLAVARCEHSLGNSSSEVEALLEAARYFKGGSEINAAISAYRHAIKICDPPLLTPIYAELAQMYHSEGRFIEAGDSFKEGNLAKEAAQSYVCGQRYDKALGCYESLPPDQMTHSDLVTQFLLKVHFFDVRRQEFQFPVVACNSENEDIVSLNILLESLVSFLKERDDDFESRSQLVAKVYPLLNPQQRDLVHYILEDKF